MWASFRIINMECGEDTLLKTRLFDCFGNQLNECLDQIQDGGNKDENLQRFSLLSLFFCLGVAWFLFPPSCAHVIHL